MVPQAEVDANPDFQEIRKVSPKAPLTESLESGSRKDKPMPVNVLVTAKGLPLMTYGLGDRKWLPPKASGLLGAIGRAAGGTDQAADAYVDIDPGNFSSSATAAGTKVLDLFAKALTTP